MTACESVWLAIRVGFVVIGIAATAIALFMGGYERGRRVQAEEDEAEG